MTAFARRFTVRWADVDANGHMRNTAFSEMCNDTRVALLAAGGYPWRRFQEEGIGPVLFREEIEYRREAAMGEEVVVDVVCGGLSPDAARWILRHRMRKASGEEMARVGVAGGWLDVRARRLVVPPPDLAGILRGTPRDEVYEELPPLRR